MQNPISVIQEMRKCVCSVWLSLGMYTCQGRGLRRHQTLTAVSVGTRVSRVPGPFNPPIRYPGLYRALKHASERVPSERSAGGETLRPAVLPKSRTALCRRESGTAGGRVPVTAGTATMRSPAPRVPVRPSVRPPASLPSPRLAGRTLQKGQRGDAKMSRGVAGDALLKTRRPRPLPGPGQARVRRYPAIGRTFRRNWQPRSSIKRAISHLNRTINKICRCHY